jgi:hypothetical protein
MVGMAQWAVTIPAERWATERLFHHDTLTVPGSPDVAAGDEVLLVAGAELVAGADAGAELVALGRVEAVDGGALEIAYTRRAFDAAVPADDLKLDGSVTAVEAEDFRRAAARLGGDRDRTTWLVSVALPIEAASPAEAVRQFWSHVVELGPGELPAYVWPSGDELAMQAFVLGAEANQDPEEEDEP